jgi:hypothetical protein
MDASASGNRKCGWRRIFRRPPVNILHAIESAAGRALFAQRTRKLRKAAKTKGIGLSFHPGATLPDPRRILQGSGKQNRFVRLDGVATLRRPEVEELFCAAEAQADPPFVKSGGGKLISFVRSPKSSGRESNSIECRHCRNQAISLVENCGPVISEIVSITMSAPTLE